MRKTCDTQVLLDSGLLFEINRRVLHPFGLALEAEVNEDGTRIGAVWDYRDDPEGLIFDDVTFADGLRKLNEFMVAKGQERLTTRHAALGYVIQGEADVAR